MWFVKLATTSGLGDVAVFENRQPVTAAKFIIKSSFFMLKLKDTGQAETKDWLCFLLKIVGQAPIA